MCSDEIATVLNTFARWPRSFSFEELFEFADSETPAEPLLSSLLSDPRFIRLDALSTNKYRLISEYTLFRWFTYLSLSLAQAREFRLKESQLARIISNLRPDGRWDVPPVEAIRWGQSLGFVGSSCTPGDYVFPLSRLLSYLPPPSVRRAVTVLSDLAECRKHKENLKGLVEESLHEGLSQFSRRVAHIVKAREGILTGKRMTLEQLGTSLRLTRERVRQLEETFWTRLGTGRKPWRGSFLVALFAYVMDKSGSLIIRTDSSEAPRRAFLAKCCGIPQVELSSIGISVLAASPKDLTSLTSTKWFPDEIDLNAILKRLATDRRVTLIDSDARNLGEEMARYRRKRLTRMQRIYLALRSVGKPAHYGEIAEVYSALFPDRPMTENGVHSVLSKEGLGVVWIGIRGTFALREWGFERPSKKLFDAVAEIVQAKYAETAKPVAFTIIVAEIGRYRPVIKASSVAMAAHLNPRLKLVSRDCFIPRDPSDQIDDEMSAERLDQILQSFSERT